MPNNDENVNPLSATNEEIAELLAKRYGQQLVEELYALLSDTNKKIDIESVRQQFAIPVDPNLKTKYVDQHIADAVYRSVNGTTDTDSVQDIQVFINLTNTFNLALNKIMDKHGIKPHMEQILKIYIAKGNATAVESTRNIVTVEMDKTTKELMIRINPKSRNGGDLKAITPLIYKSWGHLRKSQKKWQPSKNAPLIAEIARYYQQYGERKTLHKYMEDGFEADAIMRAIGRIKRKSRQ